MEIEFKIAQLQAIINALSLDDRVKLSNAIGDVVWHNYDDHIYKRADLDDLLNGASPTEIARLIVDGDFSPYYTYWRFDGRGNLESIKDELDIEIELNKVLSVYEQRPDILPGAVKDFFNELEKESDAD